MASNLAKNPGVFHRMPNGLFGLLDWYPEAAERRKTPKKNGGKEQEESEEAVSE